MTGIVRGNKSIGMTTIRAPEPTLPLPDFAQDPTNIIQEISQKLASLEIILERKAEASQIRSLVAISDEMLLLQAKDIVIAGQVTFVDLLKDWNGVDGGSVDAGITRIRGGVIQTGVIISNNWSDSQGTSWDLDNGIVVIGGADNPSMYFEDGDLFLSGSITAESLILTKDLTLGELADMAENALPAGEFGELLNIALQAGVDGVLAGMSGDYRLDVSDTSIIASHKDANLSGLGAGYVGDIRTGLAITGTGIAMGFNSKSTGNWVNAVSIGATGDVAILGTLTAGSIITGSVMVNGVAMGTVVSNAAAGQSLSSALLSGGSAILTGVIQPVDTGGIRTGTISWNPTTGALTGGTGVAVTEWGIIGASAGSPTFTINAVTGAATFAGALQAATGTFAGSISAASGTFTGNIDTLGHVRATGGILSITDTAAIVGQPAIAGVAGVIGRSTNAAGVIGSSSNSAGVSGSGLFGVSGSSNTAGGRGVTGTYGLTTLLVGVSQVGVAGAGGVAGVYGANTPAGGAGGRFLSTAANGVALDIPVGYISRPYSTTGRITVYDQTTGAAIGTYRYEFGP